MIINQQQQQQTKNKNKQKSTYIASFPYNFLDGAVSIYWFNCQYIYSNILNMTEPLPTGTRTLLCAVGLESIPISKP